MPMFRRTFLPVLGLASVVAMVASCSSSETADDGKPQPEPEVQPCQQADIDACLDNQKSCAMSGGSAVCSSCEAASYAAKSGACEPIPGETIEHDFSEFTTQPGDEVLGLCQSWTLNNEEEIWVNAVELSQGEASHHSNWTFVPDTKFTGDDGVWNCADRNYDELSAAVAGGVLYAQSTQATHEVQKFPEGAAVRLPPHVRIIGDVHLLNVTSEPVSGHLSLTLYTIGAADVTHKLVPFHMSYNKLAIPPLSTSRFTGSCDLSTRYETLLKHPYGGKVYYALPHTHSLGSRFFLHTLGEGESKVLLDVIGFNGEARGKAYDPPIDLAGTTGLEFGCEFVNPRSEEVDWGFGDQEMCEMLGFWESDAAFTTAVDTVESAGTEDGTQLFDGTCNALFIPWTGK